MNLAQLKANFLKSPKTTIAGLLSLVIALTTAWMLLPPKASVPVTIVALAKALVECMKQDAGRQEAKLPDGSTQSVPSHEIPNDPAAIPVDAADPHA